MSPHGKSVSIIHSNTFPQAFCDTELEEWGAFQTPLQLAGKGGVWILNFSCWLDSKTSKACGSSAATSRLSADSSWRIYFAGEDKGQAAPAKVLLMREAQAWFRTMKLPNLPSGFQVTEEAAATRRPRSVRGSESCFPRAQPRGFFFHRLMISASIFVPSNKFLSA